MLLAVDVGNTQTVIGLFDGQILVGHWRVATDPRLTADQLRVELAGLLPLRGLSISQITEIILSSVVPRVTMAWEQVSVDMCGREAMVVGPGLKTGMPVRYGNPHEVGADRIVNGVAAYERLGGPVVVVDFGTATTIDVITGDGAYLGGAIAPGVETSAEALFSKAARLAKVDLEAPPAAIGTTTRDSVRSGLMYGQAGMVDGLVRRVWAELGTATPVLATGGLAEAVGPLCETVTEIDEDLTLAGLRLIRDRNR